jgi:hypothetical protein
LDGLQNNLSGLNRRMVTLESNLIDRVGMPEARMAGLEDRADQLVDRISALETSVDLPSMKLDTGASCINPKTPDFLPPHGGIRRGGCKIGR